MTAAGASIALAGLVFLVAGVFGMRRSMRDRPEQAQRAIPLLAIGALVTMIGLAMLVGGLAS